MSENIYILVGLLAYCFGAHVDADPEARVNPFRPGSKPKELRLVSWESIATYPNSSWGKVIEIDGWLMVKARQEGLRFALFKTQECLDYARPKTYLECDLDEKTIHSYKNGNLEEWKKLHGKYVRCWAIFKPTPYFYSDKRIGWLKGPFRFVLVNQKLEEQATIETPGDPWPK